MLEAYEVLLIEGQVYGEYGTLAEAVHLASSNFRDILPYLKMHRFRFHLHSNFGGEKILRVKKKAKNGVLLAAIIGVFWLF